MCIYLCRYINIYNHRNINAHTHTYTIILYLYIYIDAYSLNTWVNIYFPISPSSSPTSPMAIHPPHERSRSPSSLDAWVFSTLNSNAACALAVECQGAAGSFRGILMWSAWNMDWMTTFGHIGIKEKTISQETWGWLFVAEVVMIQCRWGFI